MKASWRYATKNMGPISSLNASAQALRAGRELPEFENVRHSAVKTIKEQESYWMVETFPPLSAVCSI
jgi:hypothetical protein